MASVARGKGEKRGKRQVDLPVTMTDDIKKGKFSLFYFYLSYSNTWHAVHLKKKKKRKKRGKQGEDFYCPSDTS